MNDLQAERTKLNESIRGKGAERGGFRADLVRWKGDNEGKLKRAVTDLAAERAARATIETKMKELAESYGIPEDELALPAPAASPAPVNVNPANPGGNGHAALPEGVVMRDDLIKALEPYPFVASEIMDMQAEHVALFGAPLFNSTEIVKEAVKSQKAIRAVWEQKFDVPKKREEVAAAKKATEEARIRSDERTKVLSEFKLNASNNLREDTPHSFVVDKFRADKATTPPPEIVRGVGVDAAVSAWNEGKYRQPASGR